MGHANARLTVHGRCLLVRRVRVEGRPVSHVAKEMGISRQCAHRWMSRFDQHGWSGLHDRPSQAHTQPRRTPAAVGPRWSTFGASYSWARSDRRDHRRRTANGQHRPAMACLCWPCWTR